MSRVMRIGVDVPGVPAPQGSKTVYRGRAVDSNAAALKPWRHAVTAAVVAGTPDGWDPSAPMSVAVLFRFGRPKGHFTGSGALRPAAPEYKTTRPDLDKLVRAVLDACTDAGAWRDDSQVFHLAAGKFWSTRPGLDLTIDTIRGQ